MKSAMVRARIDVALKQETESILHQLGLSASEAIILFYKQTSLRRGLPFEVSLPNEETLATFEATDKGEDIVCCADANDLFAKLNL